VATARSEESLKLLQEAGIRASRDNREAVREADAVILTVKPIQFEQLANEVGGLGDGKLILSFIAGVESSVIRSRLGGFVYRCMTNIALNPVAVSGPQERRDDVVCLFNEVGSRVVWVDESLMDPLTILLGSGPALLTEVLEAFIEAGVYVGIPWDLSESIALDLLEITARMRREMRRDDIIRLIATPGGTTITALTELGPVRTTISRAFERALSRLKK